MFFVWKTANITVCDYKEDAVWRKVLKETHQSFCCNDFLNRCTIVCVFDYQECSIENLISPNRLRDFLDNLAEREFKVTDTWDIVHFNHIPILHSILGALEMCDGLSEATGCAFRCLEVARLPNNQAEEV